MQHGADVGDLLRIRRCLRAAHAGGLCLGPISAGCWLGRLRCWVSFLPGRRCCGDTCTSAKWQCASVSVPPSVTRSHEVTGTPTLHTRPRMQASHGSPAASAAGGRCKGGAPASVASAAALRCSSARAACVAPGGAGALGRLGRLCVRCLGSGGTCRGIKWR